MKTAAPLGLAAALCITAAACERDQDAPVPADETKRPSIRLLLDENAGDLPADGTSVLTLTVRTTDAEEQPEDEDVTVTVTGGRLTSSTGTVDSAGRRLLDRTADGGAVFGFVCTAGVLGEVTVEAKTDEATTRRRVVCVSPSTFPSLSLTVSDPVPLSGTAVTLTASAIDARGLPAGSDSTDATVRFFVSDAAAVVTPASASLEEGSATAELIVPTLGDSEVERVISAVASYHASVSAAPVVASVSIRVVSPALLVLTPRASRTSIRADLAPAAPESSSVVEVVATKAGVPQVVSVTFSVVPPDSDRIGLGVRPNLTTSAVVAADASGRASHVVSAQSEAVRGPATVLMSALDTSVSPPVQATAEITLEVEAVRSVVFAGATPPSIGVRGSANPTSTIVSFLVLNDLSEPMEGVEVRFDLPGTADPGAAVTGSAVSDAGGRVQAVLSSGTHAGPLQVRATVTTLLATFVVVSDPVAVTAGLPSFSNSHVVCEGVVHVPSSGFECSTVVADRFSNRGPNMVVQFRAEGGSITPFGVTDSGEDGEVGAVRAEFVRGEPGLASAEVADWSYGRLVPRDVSALPTGGSFDRDACFDGSTSTACDLYTLCREGAAPEYCPLPVDPRVGACWLTIPSIGLELMGVDTGRCNTTPSGGDVTIACDDGTSLTYATGTAPELLYVRSPAYADAVDALRAHALDCGFPITCLTGKAGFDFVAGDECSTAPGCFDFDPWTPCPEAGLVTVIATVRGEEGFVDENGNGRFDFTDANGNGRHDVGEAVAEPWVDMPEPFLDKNDNCSFDTFSGSARREAYDEIRASDLFSDEDDSGDFGYRDPADMGDAAPRLFSNDRWDDDKELVLSTRQLYLTDDEPMLWVGERCTPADVLSSYTCANGDSRPCVQIGRDFGLAACRPARLVAQELIDRAADNAAAAQYAADVSSAELDYVWADANGNCSSPELAATTTASVEGAVALRGVVTTDLDASQCGISPTGNGERNSYRPWCEEYASLGAKPIDLRVIVSCDGGTRQGLASVTFEHSGGTSVSYGFTVVCPYCGDAILTTGEACDPEVPVGEVGYDASCTPACTIP